MATEFRSLDIDNFLKDMVHIGRTDAFQELKTYPGIGNPDFVVRLADTQRKRVLAFASSLDSNDLVAFVKSITLVEDSIGGLGSVTNIPYLLSLVQGTERTLLDWILRNHSRYYYSKGARTINQYDQICRVQAQHRRIQAEADERRHKEAMARIAEKATRSLFNAVRRGDLGAVLALLKKGAEPNTRAPDGRSMLEVAISSGRESIANALREAGVQ
jgi:hypothetical protein